MQSESLVARAVAGTADVVRGVKPDQLAAASPCRDWDVRAVASHLLQVISALHLAGRAEAVPDELWQRDLMSGDWAARFDDQARGAVAAWADPRAVEGTVRMGSAEMPAQLVCTMLVSDVVIHGWDLAAATGQDYHCADDTAEVTYQFLVDTGEQGRSMGLYAQPVSVAEDAPVLHRALGLSGRDPQWTLMPR